MTSFIVPRSSEQKYVDGDVYSDSGPLGRTAFIDSAGSNFAQNDSQFLGEYYYNYIIDPTADIIFTLGDIGNPIEVGYTCCIYNKSASFSITVNEDGGSTIGVLSPQTYGIFTAKVAGANDTWEESITLDVLRANFIYVDASYGTVGGTVNRIDDPFSTLAAADAAASSGDVIFVRPGSYTVSAPLTTLGVKWFFQPNAEVSVSAANCFPTGVAAGEEVEIYGWGEFTGTAANDLFASPNTAGGVVQCRFLRSINLEYGAITTGRDIELDNYEMDEVDLTFNSSFNALAAVSIYSYNNNTGTGTFTVSGGTLTGSINYFADCVFLTTLTPTVNIKLMNVLYTDSLASTNIIRLDGAIGSNVNVEVGFIEADRLSSSSCFRLLNGGEKNVSVGQANTTTTLFDIGTTSEESVIKCGVINYSGTAPAAVSCIITSNVANFRFNFNTIISTNSAKFIFKTFIATGTAIIRGNYCDTAGRLIDTASTSSGSYDVSINTVISGITSGCIFHLGTGDFRFVNNYFNTQGVVINSGIDATWFCMFNEIVSNSTSRVFTLQTNGDVVIHFNKIISTGTGRCIDSPSGTGNYYINGNYLSHVGSVGSAGAAIAISSARVYTHIKNLECADGNCFYLINTPASLSAFCDESISSTREAVIINNGIGASRFVMLGGRFISGGATNPVLINAASSGSFRLVRASLFSAGGSAAGVNNTVGTLTTQLQGICCSKVAFIGTTNIGSALATNVAFV